MIGFSRMKKSRYRLYIGLMILSGIILAVTLALTSIKIIQGGKKFNRMVLEENKAFVINTLRVGHGMMARMGAQNYESLIDLAMKSQLILYLAILDENGSIIAQSDPPEGLPLRKTYRPPHLVDGKIWGKTKGALLVTYRSAKEVEPGGENKRRHKMSRGPGPERPKPIWFLVGLDTSNFQRLYRDMVTQTMGVGAAILLLGILIIIFSVSYTHLTLPTTPYV